jgi:hypothetical protein
MALQRDPQGSRDARDAGMQRVLTDEDMWAGKVITIIAGLPKGWKGIGEDIRIYADLKGIHPPQHHNAWGGIIGAAVMLGLLVPTGGWGRMTIKRSHARKSPEYVRP